MSLVTRLVREIPEFIPKVEDINKFNDVPSTISS